MSKAPFGKTDHVKVIKTIAQGLKDAGFLKTYLELGARKGHCFNNVAPLAEASYAVDIEDFYSYLKDNKNMRWYCGKSENFLAELDKNIKFDMVFIDADHRYEYSLRDFEMVFPFVRENGLILLHDTYPTSEEFLGTSYCGDTYKTAEFIKANYKDRCEIITLPFYYGISVVRKIDRQLAWL